jgi:hypothetical protein
VALALWWLSGLKLGRRDGLRLTNAHLLRFGVTDRSAKYRALRNLEKAGLICLVREAGKNPLVTILDVCPASESEPAA